ncbi:MAG: hypothetical protein ACJA0M_002005, partial [Chitinophagales bacterium]
FKRAQRTCQQAFGYIAIPTRYHYAKGSIARVKATFYRSKFTHH